MLPNLSNPVRAYLQSMTIYLVTKSVVDCEVQETKTRMDIRGVLQPLPPQRLDIMKEGQREWIWKCLHTLPNVNLKVDDIVEIKQVIYRVVEKYDCTEYGYNEFLLAQTFEEKNGLA